MVFMIIEQLQRTFKNSISEISNINYLWGELRHVIAKSP